MALVIGGDQGGPVLSECFRGGIGRSLGLRLSSRSLFLLVEPVPYCLAFQKSSPIAKGVSRLCFLVCLKPWGKDALDRETRVPGSIV